MNNKLKTPLIISAAIIIAGAILAITGAALPFNGSAKYSIEFSQMWLCMFASVVFAFIFGFLRVNRAYSAAMAFAVLNDFLLSFSVTAIASLIIKDISALPAAIVFPVIMLLCFVFSFAQSTMVLRQANRLMRTTSRREKPFEQIAEDAPALSAKSRLTMLIISLIFLIALSFGGKKMLSVTIPLMLSSLVAYFTSSCITGGIWAVCASRFKTKK